MLPWSFVFAPHGNIEAHSSPLGWINCLSAQLPQCPGVWPGPWDIPITIGNISPVPQGIVFYLFCIALSCALSAQGFQLIKKEPLSLGVFCSPKSCCAEQEFGPFTFQWAEGQGKWERHSSFKVEGWIFVVCGKCRIMLARQSKSQKKREEREKGTSHGVECSDVLMLRHFFVCYFLGKLLVFKMSLLGGNS